MNFFWVTQKKGCHRGLEWREGEKTMTILHFDLFLTQTYYTNLKCTSQNELFYGAFFFCFTDTMDGKKLYTIFF